MALSICPFGVFATKVIVITPTVLFSVSRHHCPHHSDLATLLSTKAISQAQHEKSLNCLIEKMGIKEDQQ